MGDVASPWGIPQEGSAVGSCGWDQTCPHQTCGFGGVGLLGSHVCYKTLGIGKNQTHEGLYLAVGVCTKPKEQKRCQGAALAPPAPREQGDVLRLLLS